MTVSVTPTQLRRLAAILTAAAFLFGATEGALAKNSGNSSNYKVQQSEKHKDQRSEKHKDKDKSGGKYTEKHKKPKDKDKDKEAQKDKAPVIVKGGFVLDKLPNGTSYYRRATKDELDRASKANGGATATTGNSGGTTGTTTTGNTPPPAAPVGDTGPVVRDHRPSGNSGLTPGTIIRDHRNGADGTPMIVVRNCAGTIVTRRATDAELEKAGLKKTPAPAPVTVPIGIGGGGR